MGAVIDIDGKRVNLPNNCAPSKRLCKGHGRRHHYLKHDCGHEYCPRYWRYCPRCHGTAERNWYSLQTLNSGLSRV